MLTRVFHFILPAVLFVCLLACLQCQVLLKREEGEGVGRESIRSIPSLPSDRWEREREGDRERERQRQWMNKLYFMRVVE